MLKLENLKLYNYLETCKTGRSPQQEDPTPLLDAYIYPAVILPYLFTQRMRNSTLLKYTAVQRDENQKSEFVLILLVFIFAFSLHTALKIAFSQGSVDFLSLLSLS